MKKMAGIFVVMMGLVAFGFAASAQQKKPAAKRMMPPTISSVMQGQLGIVEHEFVSAAEAMPADKYDFAPSGPGKFDGVRTFAQEVKHVATVNYEFFSAMLGEAPPTAVTSNKEENGPDDIRTKEQILEYLKKSFALGHKAIATITARNAVTPLPKAPMSIVNTRLALASFACTHAFDHYGQMVEYLRMNGIIPPASQGQPPANPSSH